MARADDPRRLASDPAPDPRTRCPKDGTLMERVPIGKLFIVDRCASCGAMWFDRLELERVLADKNAVKGLDVGPLGERPHDTRLAEALGGKVCPRDNSHLIPFTHKDQPHIHLLACTVCGGLLLDADELLDLGEFTIREKMRALLNRF
jgi:Zn-finger nucleic acid-binding protein